jgi:hypothetical protein
MDLIQEVLLALGIVNTLLLLFIIGVNIASYIKFKAQYTLFIIVFAALFLAQYLMNAYHFFMSIQLYSFAGAEVPTYGMGVHILVLTVLQTIAFASFLWMQRQ